LVELDFINVNNIKNGLGLAQQIAQVAKTFALLGSFNPMWDGSFDFFNNLGFWVFLKIRNKRTVGPRYFKTFKKLLGFMI
jgi:hypothetical protein